MVSVTSVNGDILISHHFYPVKNTPLAYFIDGKGGTAAAWRMTDLHRI